LTDRIEEAHAPLVDPTLLSHDAPKSLELQAHALVERDDVVEGVGNLAVEVGPVFGKPDVERAALEVGECRQEHSPVERLAGALDELARPRAVRASHSGSPAKRASVAAAAG
jgi:hypothetical protein